MCPLCLKEKNIIYSRYFNKIVVIEDRMIYDEKLCERHSGDYLGIVTEKYPDSTK